jgi:hypothetical protein
VLINFSYVLIYCSFPTDSLHGYISFFFFPFLFTAFSLKTYWFLFQGLRYFFLFFFFSAGLWKIVQGGVFHIDIMSSILLNQHKEFLIYPSGSKIVSLYRWLIAHPRSSYWLYFGATALELSFIVGFFTRRFDLVLVIFYILFLIMDLMIMRINYWQTFPFVLVLLYSRIGLPSSNLERTSSQ